MLTTFSKVLLTSVAIFTAHVSPSEAVQKENAAFTIPLTRSIDGLYAFDISINDSTTIPVILDTAASMSAVRKSTFSQLKLERHVANRMVHGLIGSELSDTVVMEALSAGPLNFAGHVLILDDSDSIADPSVQGLIGTDFLMSATEDQRYLMINFLDSELSLGNRLSHFDFDNNIDQLRWSKLTNFGDNMRLLTVPVKVSGVRATAILDTGINFTVINTTLAKKLEKRGRTLKTATFSDVNGEETTMHHVNLGKVKTSNLTWNPSRALIFDAPALEHINLTQSPSILIGLNLLNDMAIIVDRKTEKMAFVTKYWLEQDANDCTGSRIKCVGVMSSTYKTPGGAN